MANQHLLTGKDIFPDWIHDDDFGDRLESIGDLITDTNYIIWEPGMDVWQAEYRYVGVVDGKHVFASNIQFDNNQDMVFTDAELQEYIDGEHIFNQEN